MRTIFRFFKNLIVCGMVIAIGYYLMSNIMGLTTAGFSAGTGQSAAAAAETRTSAKQLVFDATMYPYYDQLTDDQKKLYAEIYACAMDLRQSFDPGETVQAADVETVFRCVFCDHPELFWLGSKYNYQFYEASGRIVTVNLTYNETADDIDTAKAAFNEACSKIILGAQEYTTAYEKEKYVHNALLQNVTYDLNASLNQSAYSAMVNGSTVCAGYARSFQYLMQQLNIPCYYVIGTSMGEDHAWNIVNIDGAFYNVDVTWDDCAGEDDPYYFFNLDDLAFNEYHTRASLSTVLPDCTSTLLAHLEDENIYRNIRFTVPG